tara:strand:+ start:66 stop:470 length:405 start_codon:yes stop_codon:yes gene_type:complete
MSKGRRVLSKKVPDIGGLEKSALSQAQRVGDLIYVSGQVAYNNERRSVGGNSAYSQSRHVFGRIKALVEAAGAKMDDIIKVTMYTTDMRFQPDIWKARREFFSGDFPCSTLVEVTSLVRPEFLIEIEAIAYVGD